MARELSKEAVVEQYLAENKAALVHTYSEMAALMRHGGTNARPAF